MKFRLTMVREVDLEPGYQEPPHPQFDDLPVSMDDTSFYLDCWFKLDDPSHKCDSPFNELVTCDGAGMDYSKTTARLYKERKNVFLKSCLLCKYVTPSGTHICLDDTMSANISMYFYIIMPMKKLCGVPVLLNFTGTENFVACTSLGEKRMLTLAPYDITKLQNISSDDSEKWSLIFFMSKSPCGLFRFESALYRGWFIETMDSDVVKVQKENLPGNVPLSTFFSIIDSETT